MAAFWRWRCSCCRCRRWRRPPRRRWRSQVNKVLKTLAEPGFKDQPRDAKIVKIRSIVNEIFDYTELSKRTLGREWTKFNAQQQTEFVKLFSDLLEKTYADRLLSYSNEKVVFDKEIGAEGGPGRGHQQRPDRRRQEDPPGLPADPARTAPGGSTTSSSRASAW
ncbi:MAG: ABC transporter substrate-binding protein [Desulfomicrobium escambiense]|nr:ABC transporter substrate-binding protein [Desulfomicrobium escambiense]